MLLRPAPPLHAAVACCGQTGPTPPQLHPRPCHTGNGSDQPPPSHAAASRRLLRPGLCCCFHTFSPHATVVQACRLLLCGWWAAAAGMGLALPLGGASLSLSLSLSLTHSLAHILTHSNFLTEHVDCLSSGCGDPRGRRESCVQLLDGQCCMVSQILLHTFGCGGRSGPLHRSAHENFADC